MRTSLKQWLIFFSILLLLPIIPAKIYSKESLPKQRIVTLIYDDSGSMRRDDQKNPIDNWKYANYALQSLVGLLDSNDLLYVIPMSKPEETVNIGLGKDYRQAEIDNIRSWSGQSGTPIETVTTAMNHINDLTNKHPLAEYWMIVLTDGVFENLYPNGIENPLDNPTEKRIDTEKKLTDFTQSMLENGFTFNSALVSIESYLSPLQKEFMGDFKKLWVDTTNGSVIESENEEHIVDSINKVAALITNRDPDETKVFDLNATFSDQGVTLESPFPLRRITVLNQTRNESSRFEITDVAFNGEKRKEGIEGPYQIDSPVDPENLSPPIKGSITHIKQGDSGEVIPEGKYKLRFSEDVTDEQKRNLRFLAEPAVDFNIKVSKLNEDGSITVDEDSFYVDSEMILDVELIQSETKEPIVLDSVNKGIFNITGLVDEKQLDFTWDENRKVFSSLFKLPKKEKVEAKVTVQIEGLYHKEQTTRITSLPIRKLELKKADESPWTVKVNQLENGKPIEIIPLSNGTEMTKTDLKAIMSNVSVSFGEKDLDYDISQKGNHFLIKPKENRNFVIFTSTGEIPVRVTMKGSHPKEYAELDFTIQVQDISILKKIWSVGILDSIYSHTPFLSLSNCHKSAIR